MKAFALFLALIPCAAVAQAPIPLRNGQSVTLHGTVQLHPQGRLQFVTVRTNAAYVPILGKPGTEARGPVLHDVALSGYHRYDLLAARRGQTVTVTGKVMTDDVSPYYYKNVSLMATSIRLQDGSDLMGTARLQTVAADVGILRVTVTLPVDLSAPWKYDGPAFSESQRPDACSSNGGGDVVNCYCPLGFRASSGTMTAQGHDTPARLMDQLAQFDVGETPEEVRLQITCSR